MDITQTLQQGIAQHQAGELEEAMRLYQAVLQQEPQDPDANHNLGILLLDAGQGEAALPHLQAALEADPARGEFWLDFIRALMALNRKEEAREVLAVAQGSGLSGDAVDKLAAQLATAPPPLQKTEAAYTQEIISLFNSGRYGEAEALARLLTRDYPASLFGWKALGTLLAQQGRLLDAEPLLEKAIQLAPKDPDLHNNLGNLLAGQGRDDAAIASFRKAVSLNPAYADAHYNLGNAHKRQHELEAAIAGYRSAIKANPSHLAAYSNMGNALSDLKRFDEALLAYREALKLNPHHLETLSNLGAALLEADRLEEAGGYFQKALDLNPGEAGAHYRMGLFLEKTGKREAAIQSHRQALALDPAYKEAWNDLGNMLKSQGDAEGAKEAYQQALKIKPDYDKALNNLGVLYQEEGRLEESRQCFNQALASNPGYPEASNNLGILQYDAGDVFAAINSYETALKHKPDYAAVYSNLGLAKSSAGLFDEAVAACQQALKLDADYHGAMNNLLFCVNYHPEKSGEEIYRYYEEYETRYGAPLRSAWQAHGNAREASKRLKAGYVSPSFHHHSVRHFLEPLLSHHDKAEVEIYAYAEVSGEDAVTERYRAYADHWINTRGMSDAQLVERIRADRIDILIDVAGHTGHNRLLVFARKPAPVSLHWLDFGYTTGLKAIDYYLGDPVMTPEGSENVFSEQLWRLPATSYAYRSDPGMGEVTALPAQTNGHITFGTLTRSVRINDRVIRAWSEILKRVPGAKLNINSGNFKDTAMQAWLAERFTAHGIERERLEIGFQSPAWTVLQQTDISLDCFPHNSGTTLFESLYMGVPYITLASRPSVGTLGASLLAAIGHSEWTAQSEEDYVEKAVQLAQNLPRLAELRANLRGEMQQSPLMDEVGFARAVEQAYREMWAKWCGLAGEEISAFMAGWQEQARNRPPVLPVLAPNLLRAANQLESAPPKEMLLQLAELQDAGDDATAETAALALTASHPRHVVAWRLLAELYKKQNRLQDAQAAFQQVVALMPEDASAHFELAHVLQLNGLLEEAIKSYRKTVEIKPDFADAHHNLATALEAYGYSEAAIASYRQAIALQPDNAGVHSNLGISLRALGRNEEAIACYRQSIALNPDYAGAHNNLGIALHAMGRIDEALESFRQAIALNPDYAGAHENLGNALGDLQRFDEAIAAFERALQLNPDSEDAYNNLLYCVNYHPDKSAREIYSYYEKYEAAYGAPLKTAWQVHANDRNPARRLKVGYVSPSFHRHSVRHFLEPLLAGHDKSAVEVYAYAEVEAEDDVTRRYQTYADHWINTRGLGDEQLAERIRADRIDVLVDVAGHTAHNRLLVFARKPAPVSLHWLDFGYTTGLKAIDYYLTDAPTAPADCEHLFSETPWRLPVPAYAYRPDADTGDVTPLPAQQNGYVTFLTLTRSVRINPHVVRVWSEILKRVPNARLAINSGNFQYPAMHDWLRAQFAVHGIEPKRLVIGFQSPAWQVLQQADISLDCFPHNSGTTLFESLYMGLPFVTLTGRPSVGTLGASILQGARHDEWIAQSEEEYMEKAVQLAQNLPRLAELRANLRGEMQQSPLMDEAGFARAVEQAYRAMWRKWCGLV